MLVFSDCQVGKVDFSVFGRGYRSSLYIQIHVEKKRSDFEGDPRGLQVLWVDSQDYSHTGSASTELESEETCMKGAYTFNTRTY